MNSLIAIVSMLLLASNIALAKLSFAEAVAQQRERAVHYSNSWAVEILGGEEEADALAARHGLVNRGQVYYWLAPHYSSIRLANEHSLSQTHLLTRIATGI